MDNNEKPAKGNKAILTIITILFAITCLASLSACVLLILYQSRRTEEAMSPTVVTPPAVEEGKLYTEEEVMSLIDEARRDADLAARQDIKDSIKDTCSTSTSLIALLRDLYPEDIVYYTDGHYEFCPIVDTIPKATYDPSGVRLDENGYMEYYVNEEPVSLRGIDVSKFQGKIDWRKVAASDIDYAMVRVGIRGYETGALALDEKCEDNIKGAVYAGLPVGVYFFSQATSREEALEEAHLLLETIAPYRVTYPVAIDIEDVGKGNARTNNLTKEERTEYTKAFLETVKAAGYTPMIYGNAKSFCHMLDMEQLNDYEKWFAFYDTYIYFPYEISMWQYTDSGAVDGITGKVDFNLMFPPKN